jgi:hypothetical protein
MAGLDGHTVKSCPMQTAAPPVFSAAPKTQAERLAAALATLNDDQRAAVEHGVGAAVADDHRPLLVIAGAGSGKTNTLAHRVANLIRHGADPQRLLLLTFSRRAAAEMERRVGSVLRRVLAGPGAAWWRRERNRNHPALPWSGTFHAIGARLLRDYAGRIGLDDAFTIHDRGDAEDLLGLVRHDLGLSATKNRFPQKGTCLAIYSRVVNTQLSLAEVLKRPSRGAPSGRPNSRRCSAATSRPSRRRTCSTTTTCCCSGPRWSASPRWRGESARASTTCWSTSTRTPTCCRPRSSWR